MLGVLCCSRNLPASPPTKLLISMPRSPQRLLRQQRGHQPQTMRTRRGGKSKEKQPTFHHAPRNVHPHQTVHLPFVTQAPMQTPSSASVQPRSMMLHRLWRMWQQSTGNQLVATAVRSVPLTASLDPLLPRTFNQPGACRAHSGGEGSP